MNILWSQNGEWSCILSVISLFAAKCQDLSEHALNLLIPWLFPESNINL